nr:MAG TPA: hypothetical protein [Siphoviridae sp. ctJJg9]
MPFITAGRQPFRQQVVGGGKGCGSRVFKIQFVHIQTAFLQNSGIKKPAPPKQGRQVENPDAGKYRAAQLKNSNSFGQLRPNLYKIVRPQIATAYFALRILFDLQAILDRHWTAAGCQMTDKARGNVKQPS